MSRQRYQEPKVKATGKRRKKWKAEYYVYITVDGKEKRKHKQADLGLCSEVTKADAKQKLRMILQQKTTQTPRADGRVTLSAFIDEVFLPVRARRWSYNTRINMEATINHHIRPQLGNLSLESIQKVTIEKHLIALADAKLGRGVVERVRFLMHGLLDEAVDNDYIAKNPARKIAIPDCKSAKDSRAMTESEVQNLFASTSGMEHLLFRILVLCGLRIGEAFALRWNDVRGDKLIVDESALHGKGAPTKNRKPRPVPLAESLQLELAHWREAALDGSPDALIFPNRDGRMIRRECTGSNILRRVKKASGVKDLTFHMCRRTFATLIDGDVKDTQDMLGHATPDMTMDHYKKAIPERQRQAVEDLDRRISGVLNRNEQNSVVN